MTLENMLTKNLSEWRPATRDTLLVAEAGLPWTVAIAADHCELLGARLWELAVRRAAAPADLKLADWANQIAAHSAGLPEPLKVLEVDEQSQRALLRSQTPATRTGSVCYYEVLVQGTTTATLHRYQANPDATPRREQIAFVLTHEATAALAGTLTAQA